MTQRHTDRGTWPDLPYPAWRGDLRDASSVDADRRQDPAVADTLAQSWHVTLYVTARGLTTSPIPYGERTFQIDFDFIDHALRIETSDGPRRQMPLHVQPVADFHAGDHGSARRCRHRGAHR